MRLQMRRGGACVRSAAIAGVLAVTLVVVLTACGAANAQTEVDGDCDCAMGQPNTCGCDHNDAVCTLSMSGDTHTCTCPATHVGDRCQYECISNCAQCREVNGAAICTSCESGYVQYINPDTSMGSCLQSCPQYYADTDDDGYCDRVGHCNPSPCQNGGDCIEEEDNLADACDCTEDWKGDTCSESARCDNVMCVNGDCDPDDGMCDCDMGWEGTLCDQNIDDCSPDPCNGQPCDDGVNSHTCNCPAHLGGSDCSVQVNCMANSCNMNGDCTSVDGGVSCDCDSGWEGDNCETEINACNPDPCMNGGACTVTMSGFSCDCTDDYVGTTCTEDNPCEPTPCGTDDCIVKLDYSYTCRCDDGSEALNCSAVATTADPNANASEFKLEGPVLYGVAAAGGVLFLLFAGAMLSQCKKRRRTVKPRHGNKPPKFVTSFSNPGFNPNLADTADASYGQSYGQMDSIAEDGDSDNEDAKDGGYLAVRE